MSRSQIRRGARLTQADVSASGGSGHGSRRRDDDGCPILHVDMDAFYASCELRAPARAARHCRSSSAATARAASSPPPPTRPAKFGIHSAMPMSRAKRLCPQAGRSSPPDFALYTEVSAGVMAVFRDITPLVEPLSLDEAFLDVSGAIRRLGRPRSSPSRSARGCTTSRASPARVGVASTKFVAKLASTRAKPDGLLVVPADRVVAFLHPLPVGALWGVGEKTEEQLTRLGLRTVGDIAHTPLDTLVAGARPGRRARTSPRWPGAATRVACRPPEGEKSIGNEETFPRDVDDPEVIHRELLRLSEKVAVAAAPARLRRAHGRRSRCASPTSPPSPGRAPCARPPTSARDIYATARELYDALGLQRARLRLVGVRVEGLLDADRRPAAAAARRARARLARGRAGGRPRLRPVRTRIGAPGPARLGTGRRRRWASAVLRPVAAPARPGLSGRRGRTPGRSGSSCSGGSVRPVLFVRWPGTGRWTQSGQHRHAPIDIGTTWGLWVSTSADRCLSSDCRRRRRDDHVPDTPRRSRAALRARAATARADGAGPLRRGPEVRLEPALGRSAPGQPPQGRDRRPRRARRRGAADRRCRHLDHPRSASSASSSCSSARSW